MKGNLPNEMAKLTVIDYLALQYNSFTGELPTWLGEITKIRVLALGNNNFVGTLPKCFEKLTNLVTLGLDDNALSGDLSALLPLHKMERLYLEDNMFSHRLNSTVFSNMRSLKELDLSTNALIGTLPSSMFMYDNLTILDLNSNELTGTIPSSIPVNAKLTLISLYSNMFSGKIPSSISHCSNVTHLDLSGNQLTGDIPKEIQSMTGLSYLFLAGNDLLAGEIPSLFRALPWKSEPFMVMSVAPVMIACAAIIRSRIRLRAKPILATMRPYSAASLCPKGRIDNIPSISSSSKRRIAAFSRLRVMPPSSSTTETIERNSSSSNRCTFLWVSRSVSRK